MSLRIMCYKQHDVSALTILHLTSMFAWDKSQNQEKLKIISKDKFKALREKFCFLVNDVFDIFFMVD